MERLHLHHSFKGPLRAHFKNKKNKNPVGKSPGVGALPQQQQPLYYWPVQGSNGEGHDFSDWLAPRPYRKTKKNPNPRHHGTDISGKRGTPILSVTDGKITAIKSGGNGGLRVYVHGEDGRDYWYMHLDSTQKGLKVGQRIRAGAPLGTMGNSGTPSSKKGKDVGVHLHFEVHEKGKAIPPEQWYKNVSISAGSPGFQFGPDQKTNVVKDKFGGDVAKYENTYSDYARVAAGRGVSLSDWQFADAVSRGLNAQQAAEYWNVKSPAEVKAEENQALQQQNQVLQQQKDRHGFESSITETYRRMLGVAPGKDTLKYWMNKFDSTNGTGVNENDVSEFIRNSKQYKQRLSSHFEPAVAKLFEDKLGIADIKAQNPAEYNFVMGKIKAGAWDETDVESYIANKPEYAARNNQLLRESIKTKLQDYFGIEDLSATNYAHLVPEVKAGMTEQQMFSEIKLAPEYQQRHPGIRPDEDPHTYDQKVVAINDILQRNMGRKLNLDDPKDIDLIKKVKQDAPI